MIENKENSFSRGVAIKTWHFIFTAAYRWPSNFIFVIFFVIIMIMILNRKSTYLNTFYFFAYVCGTFGTLAGPPNKMFFLLKFRIFRNIFLGDTLFLPIKNNALLGSLFARSKVFRNDFIFWGQEIEKEKKTYPKMGRAQYRSVFIFFAHGAYIMTFLYTPNRSKIMRKKVAKVLIVSIRCHSWRPLTKSHPKSLSLAHTDAQPVHPRAFCFHSELFCHFAMFRTEVRWCLTVI